MPLPAFAVRVATNNRGLEFNYLLGAEYERKKQKLQEELQMDYKRYIDDQKRDSKVQVYNSSQYHTSSLPIAERTSVKEKLRDERNREYNLFLQEQAKSRRRGQFSLSSQPEGPANFDAVHKHPQDPSPPGSYTEHPTSRRDAATLTDLVKTKKGRKTWNTGPQKRRAFTSRQESRHSSEDKFSIDSEEEKGMSHRRKPNEQRHQSKYIKEDKHRRAERAPLDMKHDEVFISQNNNNHNWNSEAHHIHGKGKMAERFRPTRDNSVLATGLMIGQTEEQEALQRKKEQYKQELLNQIAEQRENKRKEKILGLKVAATGATDPNKPDSLRQYGSVYHNNQRWNPGVSYKPDTGNIAAKESLGLKHFLDSNFKMEHREPPGRPKKAFPTPPLDNNRAQNGANHKGYSPDTSFDEYKKDFSQMIGDVATKGFTDVPPLLPPREENSYKTPYDDAYYYYGGRHPLELMLSHNQNDTKYKFGGAQEFETRIFPQQSRASQRLSGPTQPDFGQRIAVIPLRQLSSENEQRRENALNYHEALKQQIKDIEEHRRRERKEKELYEAKKTAEMLSYNPWGRAGGGAPIKDQSGNLITDLDQMHRTNEETYRNSNITNSLGLIGEVTPRPRRRPPLPGLGHLGYNDPEHSHRQDRYKEELMQQIKEDRQKQTEERERRRIIEEEDEKRLAEERAQLLKEYKEEEQRNRMKMQKTRQDYEKSVYENKDRHQKTNKSDKGRKRPEGNKEDRPPTRDRTRAQEQRASSPPTPNLQHKRTNTHDPGPSFVTSQLTSKTEQSETAPQNHPEQVPVQTQASQQDDQQEIITKLAALRNILAKEKKHMETKLMQTEPVNEHHLSLTGHQRQTEQWRGDAAELRHQENVPSPTQKPHLTQENMQNFREFNTLKYRDTPSREELLYNYPDPPNDAPNLDLQQQALLREQQRRLCLMKSKDTDNLVNEQYPSSRNNRHVHRNSSVLPSDTAFLDVYSSEDFIPQPSAESRQRSSRHRRHNYEGEAVCVDQMNNSEPDAPPGSSDTFINQVRHSRRHRQPSENQRANEVDILSLRSTRSARERPISVGTVATEPWLRTSTAEPEHFSYRRQGRRPQAQF